MSRVLISSVKSLSTGVSSTMDSAIARSSDGQCIPFANRAFERRGHAERIDHRTLAVQRDEALARAGRRPRPCVANGRLRHLLIGDARVSKTDGFQSLDPLGLATAGSLVGTGLTGRKAARTLESLCFAGSAPGPRCSLSYARLWRAWGRASSKHQPTPTPVRTRPRMLSTTRRHTESKVPGRPPSRPSRSVWSANGLARGGHPLSASLTMRLTSPQYG